MMSCLFATISFSQKLFKVDRTKSAKTAVAKSSASNSTAKPKTSSVPKKGKTFAKRKYRSKKHRKAEEAEELYILINGKYVEEDSINYTGGEIEYYYSSNVENLGCNFLQPNDNEELEYHNPNWCHFSQDNIGTFKLKFDPNPTRQSRTTLFVLESYDSDVPGAFINITQAGKPIAPKAKIWRATLNHNAKINGENNLQITINADFIDADGLNCGIVAAFFDESGTRIKAASGYSKFADNNGHILIASLAISPTKDFHNQTVTLTIPNDCFDLWNKNKKHKITCALSVYCWDTQEFLKDSDNSVNFKTKEKKKKIITESP